MVILCHFYTVKQTPQKSKILKSPKISLNDTNRSIQKPIPTFLRNFGSVKLVLVISFLRKCHFRMPKVGLFCPKLPFVQWRTLCYNCILSGTQLVPRSYLCRFWQPCSPLINWHFLSFYFLLICFGYIYLSDSSEVWIILWMEPFGPKIVSDNHFLRW